MRIQEIIVSSSVLSAVRMKHGAVQPVGRYDCGYGEGTMVPDELILALIVVRKMFQVRGYGNLLQGKIRRRI